MNSSDWFISTTQAGVGLVLKIGVLDLFVIDNQTNKEIKRRRVFNRLIILFTLSAEEYFLTFMLFMCGLLRLELMLIMKLTLSLTLNVLN